MCEYISAIQTIHNRSFELPTTEIVTCTSYQSHWKRNWPFIRSYSTGGVMLPVKLSIHHLVISQYEVGASPTLNKSLLYFGTRLIYNVLSRRYVDRCRHPVFLIGHFEAPLIVLSLETLLRLSVIRKRKSCIPTPRRYVKLDLKYEGK